MDMADGGRHFPEPIAVFGRFLRFLRRKSFKTSNIFRTCATSRVNSQHLGCNMSTNTVRGPGKHRRKRKNSSGPLFAAVDLGTNNCRLLVAKPQGKRFLVVDSHSQMARLGEGLQETGRLSDAAMERAFGALTAIRKKLKSKRVGNVRCIATEACRRAENGAEFIRAIQDKTGLSFKIISPKEEARLALLSCYDLIDEKADRVLVVDIGGGSTEFSLVNAKAARESGFNGVLARAPILNWTSLPLGVVTLTEAFSHLAEEEAWPAMLNHARETIAAWAGVDGVAKAMKLSGAHMIGTSGTVTSLASVHQKLEAYRRDKVDGTWLDIEDAKNAITKLKALGVDGRSALPTIGPGRAKLMLAGCAIIQTAWELFPVERLRVADRGLREGLLLSMMYGPKKKRRRARSRRRKPKTESVG